MAAAILTHARLRELLHYYPETGVFTWRATGKGRPPFGAPAGWMNKRGYVVICVLGRHYVASVLAWFYMTVEWPALDIDHKDNVRSHNWWSNLRHVTRSVNNQNRRRPQSNNKARRLGVCANRNRWSASINVNGKKIHLGTFDTPAVAYEAYLAAKRKVHPGNML